MLNFKPLSLEDKKIFDKYINPYKFKTSDFSFIDIFMWRNAFDISYCIYDDALIIKKIDFDGSICFLQPLGYRYDNLEKILKKLEEFKRYYDAPWLIKYAETSFVEDLTSLYPNKYFIKEDRDSFDYIYDSKKLISLSGNVLSKKRNNYNHFIKNNNYKVKIYNNKLLEDCIYISKSWYEKCSEVPYLSFEADAVRDLLENSSTLSFECIVVYVDDMPCGFSIGEKLNKNMALIHIEKADRSIRGLYSFINKCFVETFYNDIPYINREEDLGVNNLRKSKLSYNPLWLEKKYFICS